MRENYSKPISQIEEFQQMDILTTSSSWNGGIDQGEVED